MTELHSNPYYYSPLQSGIDRRVKELLVHRCLSHIKGPQILDLGFVDNLWSDPLLARDYKIDIVEGAATHVESARQLYQTHPRVRIFHQLFENYTPDVSYDTVIAGDMIRYLPDPRSFLANVRSWLPTGKLLVTVPNSFSLHRRIGTLMGRETHPTVLNEQDKSVGNLTSYDRYQLRKLLIEAGYVVEEIHGFFLKPLSSAQMADWSQDLLHAFTEIGNELEDYAWFLYALARPGK